MFNEKKYSKIINILVKRELENDEMGLALSVVDLYENVAKDDVIVMKFINNENRTMELEELKKDSYEMVSKFNISQAFRSIQTEELSKEKIGESFRRGIRYAERAGVGDTRRVRLAREMMNNYYRDFIKN